MRLGGNGGAVKEETLRQELLDEEEDSASSPSDELGEWSGGGRGGMEARDPRRPSSVTVFVPTQLRSARKVVGRCGEICSSFFKSRQTAVYVVELYRW